MILGIAFLVFTHGITAYAFYAVGGYVTQKHVESELLKVLDEYTKNDE